MYFASPCFVTKPAVFWSIKLCFLSSAVPKPDGAGYYYFLQCGCAERVPAPGLVWEVTLCHPAQS